MLAQKTIEQVKAFSDIVGIISTYVNLKKRGRNFIGLCPFHQEKTPSFTVSPEKHIWHCFGCHESGDGISFIMKIDNLSFQEAIVQIANFAGIEVIKEENKSYNNEEEQRRTKVREALLVAREAFKKHLAQSELALNYLYSRKINDKSINDFHLGFCPSDCDLSDVKNLNLPVDLILKTGLFYKNEQTNTLTPKFKNRIIFPIIDYQGKTLGFAGRIISEQPNTAKYLNSEESSIFNKRKIIYGLNQAYPSIKKEKSVILMEGYMDVITAHQFGIDTAIATMGTALTLDHITKLKRFTDTVYLAMDSDEAGQKSIEKSYYLLQQHNLKIKIVNLPSKDPADFILKYGSENFKKNVENSTSIIDFKLKRTLKSLRPDNIDNISKILENILPLLRAEQDILIQRYYIDKISQKLNIKPELIMAKLKKNSYNIGKFRFKPKKSKYEKTEEYLLYLIASDTDKRQTILDNITSTDFITQKHRHTFDFLKKSGKTNKDLISSIDNTELKNLITKLLIENINTKENWQHCLNILKSYKIDQRIEEIKLKIKEYEAKNQEDELIKVQNEYLELQKLSKHKS